MLTRRYCAECHSLQLWGWDCKKCNAPVERVDIPSYTAWSLVLYAVVTLLSVFIILTTILATEYYFSREFVGSIYSVIVIIDVLSLVAMFVLGGTFLHRQAILHSIMLEQIEKERAGWKNKGRRMKKPSYLGD